MSHTPVERVLGTIEAYPVGERRVERVPVSSDDLARRLLRIESSIGALGIRLEGEALHDGAVVYADAERVVCVQVASDDVLAAFPADIAQAIEIAHALGNRHLPIQRDGDTIVLRYDPLVEELFVERGVRYARERRRLNEPFRHAHAPHGHG